MVLNRYDNKLLEFMYLLTKKQKHMNSIEIARYLSSHGKKITDRTIRRWFHYLHKYHFDYFPYPKYGTLGLVPIFTLVEFNEKLLEVLPYRLSIIYGINFQDFERCLINTHLIPTNHLNDFKALCSEASEYGIFKKYFIFDSAVAFFSPFHKIFKRDGLVEFPENYDIDNSYFTGLLRNCLQSDKSNRLEKEVKENPLIIPIILEYFREHRSSHGVWNSFRRKLGDGVWGYVKDPKIRRLKKKGSGIRLIQKTMKELHDNFHEFFQQIRVVYYPFYAHENNIFYMFLKLKRKNDIIPLSEALSKHSVSIVVYPPMNPKSKEIAYYILTNKKETLNIISNLIHPYIDKSYDNKIIYEDFEASMKYRGPKSYHWRKYYLRSNYHRLFNPKTVTWKFDIEKYKKRLYKLK
ncbi:MAG: hypothetical protein ACE5J7_01345 [Candidatus Aenigmatarchaeota archaeon]